MQASKYILIRVLFGLVSIISTLLVGCGEKTPEQIAQENKKLTDISVRRARVLMFEDKSPEAIKLLEETYQKCGSSPELCEALAYAYAQNEQLASAAMFFENASEQKGGDPELQINAAKAYEQSKAYDSATKAYQKYLKLKPTDIIAWKSLSACQEKNENYAEALNSMMSALKAAGRNPNTSEAAKIGLLFIKIGNAPQAQQWLNAAYDATLPTNTEVRKEILLGLVTVYLAKKEMVLLDETIAKLDKIYPKEIDKKYPELRKQIKTFKDNLKAAQEATIKAEEQKKKEEAEAKKIEDKAKQAQDEKKSENKPESKEQESIDNTETPAKDSEPLAEGEAAIKEAETKDLTEQEAQLSEYDLLVQKSYDAIAQNKGSEAEKLAHLAISKDSKPELAWRALAKAYEISNKANDSYMAACEAYKRNPDNIDATLFYLRTASRVLNNEKFLNEVYKAYEKFPNNPEIWVDLARTYNLIGNRTNAIFFYKQFLTHTPKEHPLYEEMSAEFAKLTNAE